MLAFYPFELSAQKIHNGMDVFSAEQDSFSVQSSIQKSNSFYDSLRSNAYKWKWTKKLYDITFDSTKVKKKSPVFFMEKWEKQYRKYAGKVIRRIKISEKNVFGIIGKTKSKSLINLKKHLNKHHINTKREIIRRNLLFRTGDQFDPYVFAENERLFFELPYIQNVTFDIIDICTDSVDVEVITQDAFSLGAAVSFPNYHSVQSRIYNENILGLGQNISGSLLFDTEAENICEFVGGQYEVFNIKGSFATGKILYSKDQNTELYDFSVQRNFFSTRIKTTEGFEFGRIERFAEISDSLTITHRSVNNFMTIGFGIPKLLNSDKDRNSHKYLNYMASLSNKDFSIRPDVSADSNRFYHNSTIVLFSLGMFKNDYYKTSLIYNFGRVEYIPYGYLIAIMAGPDFNEFCNRIYVGTRFAGGKYIKDIGYFFSKLEMGNFFLRQNLFDEGIINSKSTFFSPLINLGKYKLRNMLELQYIKGINRDKVEFVDINDENGIRGFENDNVKGDQRLGLDIESILFTPQHFYGFRFALFGFLDMAHICDQASNIFSQKLYSGFGIGVRVRNEQLVLKTFQIRLGFYPNSNSFKISISGESVVKFEKLLVSYPQVIPFQ